MCELCLLPITAWQCKTTKHCQATWRQKALEFELCIQDCIDRDGWFQEVYYELSLLFRDDWLLLLWLQWFCCWNEYSCKEKVAVIGQTSLESSLVAIKVIWENRQRGRSTEDLQWLDPCKYCKKHWMGTSYLRSSQRTSWNHPSRSTRSWMHNSNLSAFWRHVAW